MITKSRSTLGATLLEIMLVLAVAAMVIVMSIRYYRNATNAQNVNALLAQFQAITAAADNIAQGSSGSYAAVDDATLLSLLGDTGLDSAFGTISTSGASPTGYTVTTPALPNQVCASLRIQLGSNPKMYNPTCTTGVLSYTYRSTE